MNARIWAAVAVGIVFAATFTLIANMFVGAACGLMAMLMTAFVLSSDEHD